jgi:hypothetical protein
MSGRPTPPPIPPAEDSSAKARRKAGEIADMCAQFARKTPQTLEDRTRARAFITGKIDMIRSDPTMSEAEKAAAIAELKQALERA